MRDYKNSRIADTVYDIMANHIVVDGVEAIYDSNLIEEVVEYFDSLDIQWDVVVSTWPSESGGSVYCSWIEDGFLVSLAWDYYR